MLKILVTVLEDKDEEFFDYCKQDLIRCKCSNSMAYNQFWGQLSNDIG